MSIDPIALAETIRKAYAVDLIGKDPATWKSLLLRYGSPEQSLDEKLRDLVRMRGPYIQVLGVPAWSSSSWRQFAGGLRAPLAPQGLAYELTDAFTELGFERLYEFQEQAIASVLSDRDTLVVAGTGRGKTESWMLPLLHFIIAAKRGAIEGVAPRSTKALLIYPTKALAQDQLRRLIGYLFRLNRLLDRETRVTVGIYDGDTPSRQSLDKRSYLYQAFSQFRCPIYSPAQAKCQRCTTRLTVISHPASAERLTLALPQPECRDLVDLDFVQLTREDIEEGHPDILITNPDMLNLRLLDINDVQRRDIFIREPRFLVLDEVHTYTELFGSFTGMILRRLRQQRKTMSGGKADSLRVIAASATVANKEQLFSRLCGLPADRLSVAQERTEPLPEPPSHEASPVLHSILFSEEFLELQVGRLVRGEPVDAAFASLLGSFNITQRNLPDDVSEAADALGETMFSRLRNEAAATPGLHPIRAIHRALSETPMTPDELIVDLRRRYVGLDEEGARRLAHNFQVLGAFSGLVEGRVHMFAWPVDGMYVCVGCGKIYDEARGSCEACGGGYISKIAVCSVCGQEAVESWMCPHCTRLYPVSTSVDGEMVYYQRYSCSCTGSPNDAVRVLWRPYYRCDGCGKHSQLATIPACGECDSRLVDRDGKWTCSNPKCGRSYVSPHTHRCGECDGSLRLAGNSWAFCQECGSEGPAGRCDCGGARQVTLSLPWVCKRCGEPAWGEAPSRCGCGGTSFAMAGLFDLSTGQRCEQCKADYLEGHGCGIAGHTLSPAEIDFQEYKIVDSRWRIDRPSNWQRAVPCHHRNVRYQKGARYEPLMRSPANVAVTSAQYALRSLIGEVSDTELSQRLRSTKMMAFSDSYADMEELGRDFDEPEMDTFIDQLVMELIGEGQRTLGAVVDEVIARIEAYGRVTQAEGGQAEVVDWVEHFGGRIAIRELVESRFLPGRYRFRWRYRPALIAEGLANIRLERPPRDARERRLLAELLRRNRGRLSSARRDLLQEYNDFDALTESLSAQGLITLDIRRDAVTLSPEAFVCTAVGAANPIMWDPERERFYSDLDRQMGLAPDGVRPFTMALTDRVDIQGEAFSRVAYRVATSRPLILRSAIYKGDIPKEERRKIEDSFKNGADTHFLSTGPAMEVGIDIGALDLLLLMGTPPNINAYLQRIGRAGRRSKRSLIFSVSKRNPIDFYYYRRPLDLIRSAPQPVPLNEHNEEVLRVSLTWALLDFLAANYWVPWKRDESPDGVRYTDGEPVLPREEQRPANIITFTRLIFSAKTNEIDYGGSLQALVELLERRVDDARSYLKGVLDYAVCAECGSLAAVAGPCTQLDCQGSAQRAGERYATLVEDVIVEFDRHLVEFPRRLRSDLTKQRRSLEDQRRSLEDELADLPNRDAQKRRELNVQIDRLTARIQSVQAVAGDLAGMTLAEAQRRSGEARYAYQIRSVSPTVDVVMYREEKHQPSMLDPRQVEMAIREYHPYAVTLRSRERYVTCEVEEDAWLTRQLHERLEQAGVPYERVYACERCGTLMEQPEGGSCPRCGRVWTRVRTIALGRAHIYPTSYPLAPDPAEAGRQLRPSDIYRFGRGENQVDSTFTITDSRVCRFNPTAVAQIRRGKQPAGMLEFGDVELATFATGAMVTYQSGLTDPRPQLFHVCADDGCRSGVTVLGDLRHCAVDPEHDRQRQTILRPGYVLPTQGLRLRLPGVTHQVMHSLAHGLRAALEKIGGVLVRSIGEIVTEDEIYLYDTTPGGAGVTLLLSRFEGGRYRNFEAALDIVRTLLECNCLDGCPQCLYQYGCARRNSPGSLSRNGLREWLAAGATLEAV